MNRLTRSVGHNLGRVFHLSGRDSRTLFWPYALLLIGLAMIATLAIIVPPLVAMLARFRDYVLHHPDPFPEENVQSDTPFWPAELTPDLSGAIVPMATANLVFVLLAAAAVVRRLHDSGRSGLWGLLPLPFMTIGHAHGADGYAAMIGMFMPGITSPLPVLNGLLWWAAMILLIVFLAAPGTKGPNRFGPEPAAAG